MKKTIVTTALAALLSAGTLAGASAMTFVSPSPVSPATAGGAVSESIQLVHERGYRDRDRDYRGRHWRYEILTVHEVRRKLRRRGYSHIRFVDRVRGDYIFVARGHRGPVRLVVDGRTGRVIARYPLRRHWREPGLHFGSENGNFSFSFGIY